MQTNYEEDVRSEGAVLVALLLAWPSYALSNTCGNVASQLTQYVAQINQIANWEANQGISGRCGWNQMCMQGMLQQLHFWYAQQANFVNMKYSQFARACANIQSPGQIDPRNPRELEEITVDDQDRNVRIRVPSNPEGFQP